MIPLRNRLGFAFYTPSILTGHTERILTIFSQNIAPAVVATIKNLKRSENSGMVLDWQAFASAFVFAL